MVRPYTAVPSNKLITRSGDPANAAPINKPLSSTIAVELEFADGSFKTMTSDDRTVFTLISGGDLVGRCRLTVSKPVIKAPMVTALEATI